MKSSDPGESLLTLCYRVCVYEFLYGKFNLFKLFARRAV